MDLIEEMGREDIDNHFVEQVKTLIIENHKLKQQINSIDFHLISIRDKSAELLGVHATEEDSVNSIVLRTVLDFIHKDAITALEY